MEPIVNVDPYRIPDIAVGHSHKLIVGLYLLQLLIRVILMVAAKESTVERYTKVMRLPHIILSILMLGTGIYLMARAPGGMQPYIFLKLALVAGSIPLGVIGGKRKSVAFTGLALLLLLGALGLSLAKPRLMSSSPMIDPAKTGMADEATLKDGQKLYEKYCMLCHGADGAAGFQGAKNLGASTLADADILNLIQNGKGVMPANTDLTAEEREKVKEYVKYMRK